jgi:hypothetical protein
LLFRRAGTAVQDGSTALLFAVRYGWRSVVLPMVQWLVTEAGSDAKSERDNVRGRLRL